MGACHEGAGRRPPPQPSPRGGGSRYQRGAAALVVTMLLFFAMLLVAVFVNRNLVFEQRASANQYRSTQAFEAAEAGLEWAQAQLNNPRRLGPDCLPTSDAAATSFRERYLSFIRTDASFSPTTWNNAGTATPLQPGCVHDGSAWSCSCPADAAPALNAPPGPGSFPAFTLQLIASGKPGIVRLVSTGCTALAAPCRAGAATPTDASARIEVALGLLGGLRLAPLAAITLRGAFDADAAPLGIHNPDPATGIGIHNPDPATGIGIHAGAGIAAASAHLTPPAGAARAGMLVGGDTALAALSPDQFFASVFGMDKAAWRNQPVVQRIACGGNDCGTALAAAIGAAGGNPLVSVGGDLRIAGPVVLGTPERPVVIVASGSAQLRGNVVIHGLLYAAALSWNDSPAPGALLRGALLSEFGYSGDAAADLFYDSALLASLRGNTGSFTRVSGSWRDF